MVSLLYSEKKSYIFQILDSTGFIVKSYNIYTDFVEIESS